VHDRRLRHEGLARALARGGVPWWTLCASSAAAGFHALVIRPETDSGVPWDTSSARVRHGLRAVCADIARGLQCPHVHTGTMRIGDFGVVLDRTSGGVILINWATLADARQWRAAHPGANGHWDSVSAAELVAQSSSSSSSAAEPEPEPDPEPEPEPASSSESSAEPDSSA
jgi:hypothetical protein